VRRSRVLRGIVDPVRRLCEADMSEPERWSRVSDVLEAALADPDLQAAARTWPKSHDKENNRYTNLLFYEDPEFGFVVNGLVKDETGRTPVHDHGHAWVAYGLLEGAETVLRYQEPPAEGAPSGLKPDELISLAAGEVDKDLYSPRGRRAPSRARLIGRADDASGPSQSWCPSAA